MEEGACSKQLSGNRLGHKPAPRRRGACRCTDRRGPRGGIRHPRSGFGAGMGWGRVSPWALPGRAPARRQKLAAVLPAGGGPLGQLAKALRVSGVPQRAEGRWAQTSRCVANEAPGSPGPVPTSWFTGPFPSSEREDRRLAGEAKARDGCGALRGGRPPRERPIGRAREDGIAAVHGGDGIDGGSRTKGQCFRTGWASVGESSLGGERRCHFLQGGSVRRQHGHHQRIRGMEAMASRWGRFGHWRRHLGRLGPRCRC